MRRKKKEEVDKVDKVNKVEEEILMLAALLSTGGGSERTWAQFHRQLVGAPCEKYQKMVAEVDLGEPIAPSRSQTIEMPRTQEATQLPHPSGSLSQNQLPFKTAKNEQSLKGY